MITFLGSSSWLEFWNGVGQWLVLTGSPQLKSFLTYVIDTRARHVNSDRSAEEVPDIIVHLLSDYSFLARKKLCRVFKLFCLVVVEACKDYPVVDTEYHRSFFSKHTMDCIRDVIGKSGSFMTFADFEL